MITWYLQNQAYLPGHPIPAPETNKPFHSKTTAHGYYRLFQSFQTHLCAHWSPDLLLSGSTSSHSTPGHVPKSSSIVTKRLHASRQKVAYALSSEGAEIIFCALPLNSSSKYRNIHTVIHSTCSNIIFMKHFLFFSPPGKKSLGFGQQNTISCFCRNRFQEQVQRTLLTPCSSLF